jgi:hypothetical protein
MLAQRSKTKNKSAIVISNYTPPKVLIISALINENILIKKQAAPCEHKAAVIYERI